MRITELRVNKFGCFDKPRRFLFSNNVNLITAPNGAGKTTVCAAIVWGLWGKFVRELDLEPGAEVSIDFGKQLVRRQTVKGEVVELTGQSTLNKTRFNEVISPIAGEFSAWSKSLWITGHNVSDFSQGSPAARFQYLSKIVDAAQYDTYLTKLRASWKAKDLELKHRREDLRFERVRHVTAYSALLNEARSAHEFLDTVKVPTVDPEQLKLDRLQTQQSLETLSSVIDEEKERLSGIQGLLAEGAICDKCGSRTEDKGLKLDQSRVVNTLQSLNAQKQSLNMRLQRIAAEQKLYEVAASTYSNMLEIHNSKQRRLWSTAKQLLERKLAESALLQQIDSLDKEVQALAKLAHCVKQAKHEYLTKAASAIARIANSYLSAANAPYKIGIRYGEDTLHIDITEGPVKSYSALSSGQKRRVDICLCLAMSQLAADIGTVPRSAPLIIDEAFDTLDSSGVEALVNLACTISKERQVFLVSHADPSAPLGPQVARITL